MMKVVKLFPLIGDARGGTFMMVGQVDEAGIVVDILGSICSVKFSCIFSVVSSSDWVLYILIYSYRSDKLPTEGREGNLETITVLYFLPLSVSLY